ncbi:lamin tail domain-containing protein [Anatilimnocola floriformis]|uniref:lamin tail domain-containing protein n=1 Tax=Anatilimnocola floriformis TaxID=2948575 RepID=UPI0020C2C5FA|nr:lamin tail domain-containing protein [Anatilimnocola floriformis]
MKRGSRRDRLWRRVFGRHLGNKSRRRAWLEQLEPRQVMASLPIISEVMAANSSGLKDADGDESDWIEIYNPTAAPINLQGWSLTDDPGDLNEWVFPAVTIGPNAFLTVFASDKDRTTGPELHTNFKLSAGGDYLALVNAGGVVVSEYTPTYPPQIDNVSYGIAFDTAELIQSGAATQVRIPTNGSLGNTWTTTGFDATGWTTGTTGVGYGVVHPGFNIVYARANVEVSDLGVARNVITTPSMRSLTLNTTAAVVNYMGTGGGGHYGSDSAFPNQAIGDDINDFVVQANGVVKIPTAGNWTFAVNSDDGFELKLERNGVTFSSEYFATRGASDTLATFNIPTAGDWNISAMMYERAGGASFELFAAPGSLSSWNATAFDLIGDTANGGLTTYAPIGVGTGVAVGTDVRAAMQNVNASAYVRIPFTVTNPSTYDSLQLSMQYDDGFVAYLNGVEVARRNAPTSLAFNSAATVDRSLADATTAESINLTPFLSNLQVGNNVLAIQGLNSSAGDDSFLVLPRLIASAAHPEQLRYFHTSTPGTFNVDPALGVIDRVSANVAAGFYNSPISVTLSTPSAGATIRYTIDGSTPTATNGLIYNTPVSISATTTLRAGAFRTDYLSLPTITRSYIFLDDVIRQSPSDDVAGGVYPDVGAAPAGWPTTWGGNVVDYGMDQTIVNQAGAAAVKSALLSLSSISITTDLSNLFNASTGIYANASQDGRDWERPASIEMLNPDGSAGFQVNAGLRIRGGYSRSNDNPKHAFRVFMRGEYGDSSLEYPLFGPDAADSFKKFDLRTAQNYSWSFAGDASNTMIQDGFARQSQLDMGEPGTHSRWVHLYIDGQYWGIYQIEERPEAEFAATYFGGSAEDYDVIKPEAGVYTNSATDGNFDAYQRLWQFVTTQDLANNANYYHIQGKNALGVDDPSIPSEDVLLDVDNLVVYMFGILHGGNLDAPISAFLGNNGINNYFAIRDRTGREGFKFIQHDAEHTLHNVNENRNGPFTAGQNFDRFNPQFLHQQLMANAEYRIRFADLVQENFFNGGPMSTEVAGARFQKDVALLDPAIVAESARWGDAKRQTSPLGKTDWLSAVATMAGFVANRNPVLISQFQAITPNSLFPTVGAASFLINGVPRSSGEILPGSVLRMAAAAGTVYYTTNGSDPRLVGGALNPAAVAYDPSGTDSTLVATNSQWKYSDKGTDLGTGWRAESFNDTAWSAGNAELGYGDGDEATVVSYGPDVNARYITTYFRKSFTVASVSNLTGLKLRLKRDDGAVVYINGVEATRSNMPSGAILNSTLASSNVGGTDEQTFYEVDLNPALLHAGTNVIAVEVHQSVANSSDVSFDASLIARVQTNPGLPLNTSATINARVLSGGVWSALTDATFSTATKAAAGNLAVTEVHYNPAAFPGATTAPLNDKQNFEFVELRNIGSSTIDLTGVQFNAGITFNFTGGDVTFLAPGQHVVVIKDRLSFEARYGTGVLVAGVYTGSLDNGGEQLRLVDAAGATIQDFTFDDDPASTPPWVTSPDGNGPSLTVRSVTGNYNLGSNWRASYLTNGTPGYEENDYPVNLTMTGGSVAENVASAVAGTLSATDPNAADTLTYSLVNDAGGRFVVVGANIVLASGVLLDYETQSSYSITARATDAGGLFVEKAFTIQVTDVAEANIAPTFVVGTPPEVSEDSGSQTVPGIASGFVPGPTSEAAQTLVAYLVQNVSNPSLFAVLPAVDVNGTLTYTLAANAFGSSTFDLRVRDSGGTANGGVDTSAPQTVTIAVSPVNDPPSFVKGANITVPYNAGLQTFPNWAASISVGPANEVAQQPSFSIAGNSLPGLFSGPITISPTGTLSFTPATGVSGTATITVAVQDDGGTDSGGVNVSGTQSFTITVSPAPVNSLPTINAIGNRLISENVGTQVVNLSGITAGGESQALQVSAVSNNTGLIANPSITYTSPNATGSLSFAPQANQTGAATITVTVRDAGYDGSFNTADDGVTSTTFTVTVAPNNYPPVTHDSTEQVTFNTPISRVFPANDPDGPVLTFAIVMLPSFGTISGFNTATGAYTYTPNAGTTGLDVVMFSVTDGLSTATGTVRFAVQEPGTSVSAVGGDLFVTGTPGDDMIIVSKSATNQVIVRTQFGAGYYPLTNQLFINAREGNDTVTVSSLTNPTTIDLAAGNDYASGSMANDTIIGGDGADQINASGGENIVWGDNVGEQNLAAGGDDVLSSLDGNDVMYGGGGNDQLYSGGGNDYVHAGQGNDLVSAGAGNDRIFGGQGNDGLYGDEGDDIIVGGSGNDTLIGRTGNDILIGGLGADQMNGDEGADLLIGGDTTNSGSSTAGDANDVALLAMLTSWNATRPAGLATPLLAGNDNSIDTLSGYTGDDDFYVNTGDLTPDLNGNGMGIDRVVNL